MAAGSTVLSARGVVGGTSLPPPPANDLAQGLAVSPAVVSPNADGYADTGTVAYTLVTRSSVTATIADANGVPVATLFSAQKQSARAISFALSPGALADGRYSLVLSVRADDGRTGTASAPFVIDRILSAVTATPAGIAPGGTMTAGFTLAGDAQVGVTVLAPDGSTVATLFEGPLAAGMYSYGWNALLADGTPAPPGHYQLLVTAIDTLTTVTQPAGFDVAAPP